MSALPVPDNGLLAFIAGICLISYLYFGIYILSIAPMGKPNRAFFYFCVFSTMWSLCYAIYYLNTDSYVKNIMERFIYVGHMYVVFLLQFVLVYTDIIKNKKLLKYIFIIIWLPPLVIIYKSIVDNAIARDFPFGFWYTFTGLFMFMCNLTSLAILLIYCFKYKIKFRQKQGLLLVISGIAIIPLGWTSDYIFGFQGKVNVLPFWVLLWTFFALYSIRKYRFISITPKMISKDICENIEEGIILLDPNLKIIFKNSAVLHMLGLKESDIAELQDIVLEKDILNEKLSDLTGSGKASFSIRINLIIPDTKKNFLADVNVKKIIDAYNDITGFLMIISKVKDLAQLKARFNISTRELEVIQSITTGLSNREIAKRLNITERTIKSHVLNIYGKLDIKNKVELINVLKRYNLA